MNRPDSKALLAGIQTRSQALFQQFAEPRRLGLIQQGLLLLLVVWMAGSLAQLFWTAWPESSARDISGLEIVNPMSSGQASRRQVSVDLDSMLGLGLFGDPINEEAELAAATSAVDIPPEGIEQGARETRLAVKLTGIVASSEEGLGTAVIEAGGSEGNFMVGDDLPVSGNVKLAKVLPKQVVLDNNGTYELLKLFDDSGLDGLASIQQETTASTTSNGRDAPDNPGSTGDAGDVRINDQAARQLAAQYRQQLYDDPQSLAQVVKVSAVRGDGGLKGYRVAPGRDAEQFRQLGFESGDVVTAVNGLALSDPANTMRLYQTMRDATDATFDVERKGSTVTISVSLGEVTQE